MDVPASTASTDRGPPEVYNPRLDAVRVRTEILRRGRNCWRLEQASRVSFLVDPADYFRAVAGAIERARHSVIIVGWDIHSRTPLRFDDDGQAEELGGFLNRVLRARPDLQVYLLEWDFSVLFAFERDLAPLLNRGAWARNERLHFRFDDKHPWGASQHQKLVVIDDKIAFAGGIDLTISRWDTCKHAWSEPRRRLPNGETYGPFHDVQMAVDGNAAGALAELARWRWERATGQVLEPAPAVSSDPWVDALHVELRDADVGIARTIASETEEQSIHEVQTLYLDAIAAARRSIYIENQYFTSPSIAGALAHRLRESSGPEVILVLPRHNVGWLEESTMGALRQRCLAKLSAADEHGRLRAVAPVVEGRGMPKYVNVHAKVLIIDDRLVRIGSSNLSRRSMGFDSECDLAVEASGGSEASIRRAIRDLRDRLLAEHLGLEVDDVARRLRERPSLTALLDGAPAGEKRLEPLQIEEQAPGAIVDSALADPNCPEAPGRAAHVFFSQDVPKASRHPWVQAAIALGLLLALGATWRWTPLSELARPEQLTSLVAGFRDHPLAPVVVLGIYAVGGLVMLPLTALLLMTALMFDTWPAVLYSVLGSSLGGLAGFFLGRGLGSHSVRRIAGSRVNQVSRKLATRGILSVAAVRVMPVAPFTVGNLVIGASHVTVRDFLIGNTLGLLPGILAINVFGANLAAAIRDPAWGSIIVAIVVLIAAIAVVAILRRVVRNALGEGA